MMSQIWKIRDSSKRKKIFFFFKNETFFILEIKIYSLYILDYNVARKAFSKVSLKWEDWLNPYVPNPPFPYPLKTENRKVL